MFVLGLQCTRANSDWATVSRTLVHILSALFVRKTVPQALQQELQSQPGSYFFQKKGSQFFSLVLSARFSTQNLTMMLLQYFSLAFFKVCWGKFHAAGFYFLACATFLNFFFERLLNFCLKIVYLFLDDFKPHHIVLPPLPEDAQAILDKHEKAIRDIYTSSILQFVRNNLERLGVDNDLPLSKVRKKSNKLHQKTKTKKKKKNHKKNQHLFVTLFQF